MEHIIQDERKIKCTKCGQERPIPFYSATWVKHGEKIELGIAKFKEYHKHCK